MASNLQKKLHSKLTWIASYAKNKKKFNFIKCYSKFIDEVELILKKNSDFKFTVIRSEWEKINDFLNTIILNFVDEPSFSSSGLTFEDLKRFSTRSKTIERIIKFVSQLMIQIIIIFYLS